MIKRLLLLLIIASGYAQAQFVTVKATVSDRNNHLYANCSWHVTFLGDPSSTLNGSAFDQSFTGTCNADAYMSLTLPQNSQIHPFGSQWTVAFCNSTGVFCASTPLTIGHSDPQDISVSLRSVAPILPSILPYLDLVANLSNPGNPDYGAARIFYNQNTARVEAIDPNGVNVLFGGGGGGGVSNIATTAPIVGGPITSTGTISCPACAMGPGTSVAGHIAIFSGTNGLTLADGGTPVTLSLTTGTIPRAISTTTLGDGSFTDDGAGTVTLTGTLTALPDTTISGTAIVSDSFCVSASCWYRGTGSPEGVVTASTGSYYTQTDSGSGVSAIWVKDNGVGNTGWERTALSTGACPTCVTATSPGAGIAHFAGSTQTVTSSAIVNADITNATIDLTAKVTGILPTANGGTANAFFTVSGPTTSAKTFTFPNASATVLTSNAVVTVPQGGTGTGSTLTGLVRGNASAMTAAELSGVVTTSGSNVTSFAASPTFTGTVTLPLLATTTKCAAAGTAANPSVAACLAAPSGSFSCATNASTGTCTVTTSAVTAASAIFVQPDSSLGSLLSVTCNTTADTGLTAPRVSARSAATSFTITLGTFATNPLCYNYWIVN